MMLIVLLTPLWLLGLLLGMERLERWTVDATATDPTGTDPPT